MAEQEREMPPPFDISPVAPASSGEHGEGEYFLNDDGSILTAPRFAWITTRRRLQKVKINTVVLVVVAVLLLVLLSSALIVRRSQTKPVLQMRADKNAGDANTVLQTFKIVQIADIHLGEAEDTDWGPEQDRKTWLVLDKILTSEDPDLIVLSGDQLTANNCKSNATAYYELLGQKLTSYGIPWATIFGNHDDTDYVDETTNTIYPAKYNRRDLLKVDQSFRLSLTQGGPSELFGTSNYILDIVNNNNLSVAEIYFFDSGGGSLPEMIDQNQIKWIQQNADTSIPAIAFQHIPSDEFQYDEDSCSGYQGESGISGLVDGDAGIVSTLMALGNVGVLAVGHQHGNDYCCGLSDSFQVCFARHSGYGGYGKWDRGARVYSLDYYSSNEFEWTSWVTLF